MSQRPPVRIASRLLRLVLDERGADEVLGDLVEMQSRMAGRRGRLVARLWFGKQVFAHLFTANRERMRSHFLGGGSVIGRQARPRRVEMSSLIQQLRYGVRKLVRAPAFTITAVVTLALGIGANVAIFSVVWNVALSPLPFPEQDRLVGLWYTAPGLDAPGLLPQSVGTYVALRDHGRTFESIALYQRRSLNLTGSGEPERLLAGTATPSLVTVLGVAPSLGRWFIEEEGTPAGAEVAVLTNDLWVTRFGGVPTVIGQSLVLDGVPHEIIGVLQKGFTFADPDIDLWVPIRIDPAELRFGGLNLGGVARIRPGTTVADARADVDRIIRLTPELYPNDVSHELLDHAQFAAEIHVMKEDVVGDVSQTLMILLGTVGFVLLIACANVANLFLVRTEGRHREMAVRTALGATRGHMLRYYFTESFLLAVMGGAAGLAIAVAGVDAVVRFGPANLPRLTEIDIDPVVLAFTAGVTLFAGLFFGAVPLLRGHRVNLAASLKEGGRSQSVSRIRHQMRNLLVVSQMALALILLVGSGLMVRSFWNLTRVEPGFDSSSVLTVRLALPNTTYPDADAAAAFHGRLLERLTGLPGVERVGAISHMPLSGDMSYDPIVRRDHPLPPGQIPPLSVVASASPGYFETMGIPLLRGRTFDAPDLAQSTGAAIVNETLAEMYWPDEDPIGKQIFPYVEGGDTWYTVVGVVGDVRHRTLRDEPEGTVYLTPRPLANFGRSLRGATIVLKTTVPPTTLAAAVQREIWALDASLPISGVRSLEDLVASSTVQMVFTMVLLLIAAGLALVLGAVGLYGVISYLVSQRAQEIGVRIALGARAGQVRQMIVWQGALVSGVGMVIGIGGALALSQFMQALLFGVAATDPVTYAGVAGVLLMVTLLASYLPARRASAIDPSLALRDE